MKKIYSKIDKTKLFHTNPRAFVEISCDPMG